MKRTRILLFLFFVFAFLLLPASPPALSQELPRRETGERDQALNQRRQTAPTQKGTRAPLPGDYKERRAEAQADSGARQQAAGQSAGPYTGESASPYAGAYTSGFQSGYQAGAAGGYSGGYSTGYPGGYAGAYPGGYSTAPAAANTAPVPGFNPQGLNPQGLNPQGFNPQSFNPQGVVNAPANPFGALNLAPATENAGAPVPLMLRPPITEQNLPPVLPKSTTTGVTPQPPAPEVPVKLGDQSVLSLRLGFGTSSLQERALAIERNLWAIVKSKELHPKVSSITTRKVDKGTDIVIGDRQIMTVTDADAKAAGVKDGKTLAEDYANRFKTALEREIRRHSVSSYLKAVLLSLATTAGLVLMLMGMNMIMPRIYETVTASRGKYIRAWRIQKAQIVSEETLAEAVVTAISILRVAIVLVLLSIYLYMVLDYFPDTHSIAAQMAGFFFNPLIRVVFPSVISYIPNIAFIVIILLIAHYVTKFTHFIFKEIEQGTITISGFDPDWADTTYRIARFLLTAFAFVLVFPYLPGSGSPAFQQVSIFLGVLVSLGSTGAISHVIAGIFLTYTGAFKVGDRVKISDTIGDVTDKTLFATRIRTNKNEDVTIPNGLVLSNHIINYSSSAKGAGLILHADVTIGYDVSWRTIHKLLIEAALETEHVLKEPEPFVLQTELDGSAVCYEINAYTDHSHQMQSIYSNLRQNIQDKFAQADIEIMTPTYHAVRNGNRSTVPHDT